MLWKRNQVVKSELLPIHLDLLRHGVRGTDENQVAGVLKFKAVREQVVFRELSLGEHRLSRSGYVGGSEPLTVVEPLPNVLYGLLSGLGHVRGPHYGQLPGRGVRAKQHVVGGLRVAGPVLFDLLHGAAHADNANVRAAANLWDVTESAIW